MGEIKYVDSIALAEFWRLAKEKMLDLVYPIGSVYISFNNTNPASLFGGNWEPIEGKFLLAADASHAVNSTDNGVLKTTNIPKFTGRLGAGINNYGIFRESNPEEPTITNGVFSVDTGTKTTYRYANGTNNVTDFYRAVDFNLGQDNPDPIYPPYIAVYMWRRIDDNADPVETFTLDQSLLDSNDILA